MRNNCALLRICTYMPKLTFHTHIHIQNILPHAHHKPLHTHMIIHTKILMFQPITHTRKYYTKSKCYNLHTYPRYVAIHSDNVGFEKDNKTRKNNNLGQNNTWNVARN